MDLKDRIRSNKRYVNMSKISGYHRMLAFLSVCRFYYHDPGEGPMILEKNWSGGISIEIEKK